MNRIAAIIVVIGMTFASLLPACGQQISTVGDVVDKGGKKLTKEEVRKLFSGATVSGFQGGNFPNTRFRNQISPNGSVSGDAWHGDVWFTTNIPALYMTLNIFRYAAYRTSFAWK